MARASFKLRNTGVDNGSYLQYPIGNPNYSTRVDNDNYLRADTLQIAPTAPTFDTDEQFIEAVCVDYNTVVLQWNVILESTLGATPVPYEAIIRYGSNGAPKSINKGTPLVTSYGPGDYTHTLESSSVWAYYTLFVRYLSTAGDDYYQPVASVKVLIPRAYNSVDDLYSRIPEYYRYLDDQKAEEYGDPSGNGPLKRFLSIFGWELDKNRTLIDYVMTMKDPQIADSEALDMLSRDLGIGFESQELGAGRLRNILDTIGFLRRSKGTYEAVTRHLRNISECDVVYNPTASPVPEIKIYAQRANLITDPRVASGVIGSIDGGYPTTTYAVGFNLDCGVVGDAQLDGDYDGGTTPTPSYTGIGTSSVVLSGGWLAYPDVSQPGDTNILERVYSDIRAKAGDVFYFSCHASSEAQALIENVYLYTGGGYSDGFGVLVADSTTVAVVGTTKYWRLEVPEDSTYTSYTDMKLVLRYSNSVLTTADDFDYFLLERNVISDYFDGSSPDGAWIVDAAGAVSDYGWAGTPYASISVYTDNFQRVKYAVNRLLPSILPVTQLTTDVAYSNVVPTTNLKYSVSWNNVIGV